MTSSAPSDDQPTPAAPDPRAEKRLARSAARLAAVQALYQIELTGSPGDAVRREFETHRIGAEIEGAQYREADLELFRALLAGVIDRQIEIDRLTDAALVARWPLGRVDPTLRAIFRAGAFELLGRPDIPPKVSINEYVDVARAFFPDGQEARFTNAVLDHMARKARPDAFSAPEGA
ncbi:MAG: transcription antitermination factor NusB [Pseudomonadota bacterium]